MYLNFNVPVLPGTDSPVLTVIYYIFVIVACHTVGDYVLQTEYQATMKGKDWYLLFVHCFLYTIPFAVCFGVSMKLFFLLFTHIIIDAAKARYQKISLAQDQALHYIIALVLFAVYF